MIKIKAINDPELMSMFDEMESKLKELRRIFENETEFYDSDAITDLYSEWDDHKDYLHEIKCKVHDCWDWKYE